LAISASVSNIVQFVGLSWLFVKKVDGFEWNEIFKGFVKIIFASTFTGFVSWGLTRVFDLFILEVELIIIDLGVVKPCFLLYLLTICLSTLNKIAICLPVMSR